MAETKAAAKLAFDAYIESYTPKYEKAADCLTRYWRSATSRPSTGSTCGPPIRSRACSPRLSPQTARLMVFKLIDAASRTWRRLKGTNQLPKIIAGVRFADGIEVVPTQQSHAARLIGYITQIQA